MKIISAIIFSLFLSGCATLTNLYDSYYMAKYDTSEHALINVITVYSSLAKSSCYNDRRMKIVSKHLFETSTELKNFSSHLPNNELTIKLNNSLHIMVEELHTRYENNKSVNKTYCELKLQSISDVASIIQKTIAKRPRS